MGQSLAVITGGSAGIGRATARALAKSGWGVLAVGRRDAELRETTQGAPGIQSLVADVTEAKGRAEIVAAVEGRSVAALVHGAGVFPRGRLETLSDEVWRNAMATNVDARLHLTLGLRSQLQGGRVLFLGSDAAATPRVGGGAYSISKAASHMLWRCLAGELGSEIAFGIVKPGLVETSMMDASIAAPRDLFPAGEVYEAMKARGETIAPETVASFLVWLLGEVGREEFGADVWDIRDTTHHSRWLSGALFRE